MSNMEIMTFVLVMAVLQAAVACPIQVVDTSQVKLETYRMNGTRKVAFHHGCCKGCNGGRSIS
jgi:hypothetical protein